MYCDYCYFWPEWPEPNIWDTGYPAPRRLRTLHRPQPPTRPPAA